MALPLISSLAAGPRLVLLTIAALVRDRNTGATAAMIVTVARWLIFGGACSVAWSVWNWATRSGN